MRNGIRIDGLQENRGRRGGPRVTTPDPNELLIGLLASAIRQTWTESGRRNRHMMGEFQVRRLEPLDPRLSRRIDESN